MNLPFRFHKETLFIFLAGSVLFFLSSRYFGGIYIRLARFWFIFFAADISMLLINSLSLRYSLDFSSDHMSKGDRITYTVRIQAGSLLPVPFLTLELARIHRNEAEGERLIRFALMPRGSWVQTREVHARLRGVYTMGLSRLCLTSLSGLLSLDLSIWARNFYVYPRVIEIEGALNKHPSPGGHPEGRESGSDDEHNFLGLREYREGEGLKNISWSRFFQTGTPWMKTWSSSGGSEIHLFLDRRASGFSPLCDDTALETFLSLLRSGLTGGQKIIIHGFPGWEGRVLETEEEFHRLYRSTLLLEFSAAGLEELDSLPRLEPVYAVTTMPDLTLLDENSRFATLGHTIVVTVDRSEDDLNLVRSLILKRIQQGAVISEITSDQGLEEELQCRVYS